MKAVVLVVAALLVGCAGTQHMETLEVRVPLPVECSEPVPLRPPMPTEALQSGVSVDDFLRAAMAEIKRREGYEGQLLSALLSCRKPVIK